MVPLQSQLDNLQSRLVQANATDVVNITELQTKIRERLKLLEFFAETIKPITLNGEQEDGQ